MDMRTSSIIKLVLLVMVVILAYSPFQAYCGTVTNQRTGTPYSSVGAALSAAGSGDVLLCTGSFSESGIHWPAVNDITLRSSSETTLCTIDAAKADRVIYFDGSVTATVEGFDLKNGYAPQLDKCWRLFLSARRKFTFSA